MYMLIILPHNSVYPCKNHSSAPAHALSTSEVSMEKKLRKLIIGPVRLKIPLNFSYNIFILILIVFCIAVEGNYRDMNT